MFSCRYSYLLVDRDFVIEKLLNDNESIYKFTEDSRQVARNEVEKKGFFLLIPTSKSGKLSLKIVL